MVESMKPGISHSPRSPLSFAPGQCAGGIPTLRALFSSILALTEQIPPLFPLISSPSSPIPHTSSESRVKNMIILSVRNLLRMKRTADIRNLPFQLSIFLPVAQIIRQGVRFRVDFAHFIRKIPRNDEILRVPTLDSYTSFPFPPFYPYSPYFPYPPYPIPHTIYLPLPSSDFPLLKK